MLKNVGEPCLDPCIERGVTLADVFAQMIEEPGAFSFARFDRKATPQIVITRHLAAREEADVLILAALRMPYPEFRLFYQGDFVPHRAGGLMLAIPFMKCRRRQQVEIGVALGGLELLQH